MKKKLILVFVFILLVSIIFGLSGCKQKDEKFVDEKEVIKIGAILPLTGDAAAWGIPPKNGALLAINHINEKGGVNGQKLELIVEDGGCDPKMGISAVNKLISVDKPIAIIGAVCSAVTLAIAPIVEKNKIVLISPASTHPDVSYSGDYIFRVIPSDELRAKVFADYILSLGHKTAVVLAINNEAGKGAELNFTKYFELNGGKVLGVENYTPEANNVKTQLTKIKELKPDIILALSQIKDAVIVLKNVKELNIKIPLFFQSEALDDPSVIENAGDAANGATYITFAKNNNDIAKSFEEAYVNQFGGVPKVFAAEAYDAVMLVAKYLREENKVNSEYLHNNLYNVSEYNGASGILTFDKNGDVVKPLVIKHIQNKNSHIISTVF